MKHRLKHIGIILLALTLTGVVGTQFLGHEPEYKGKTVTDWIKAFGVPPAPVTPPGSVPLPFYSRRMMVSNSVSILIPNAPQLPPFTLTLSTNYLADGSTSYNRVMLRRTMDPATTSPGSIRVSTTPGTNLTVDQRLLQSVYQQFNLGIPPPTVIAPRVIYTTSYYTPASDPAFLAIDHIGEAATPYVVMALQRHERLVDMWYAKLWAKCTPSIQTNYLKPPFPVLQLRRNASKILTLMGAAAKPAIPALIAALKDGDSAIRENAAEALGRQGDEAKAAVPALLTLLNDTIPSVSRTAFSALDRIGIDSENLERAVEKWKREGANLSEVKLFLRSEKLRGVTSVKVLGSLLPVWSGPLRHNLLLYLEETDGTAAVLLPELTGLLRDPDAETRYLTTRVLRAIGPGARAALPELELLTKDGSLLVSTSAIRTIAVINGAENVKP